KCETKVDIAFLVDSSGSIGRRNWNIVQHVLIDTIKEITVSADGNHVAMIHFSTRPEIVFGFHTLYGSETVELYSRKINRRRFQKGLTYIDRALELAYREIFKSSAGMRTSDEVRKIAVIITDGVQTSGSYDVISASQPLKDRGVEIYACGIGSDVDLFELYQTASNPSNVFSTNTFYSMESDFPRMIREILCQSERQTSCVHIPVDTTMDKPLFAQENSIKRGLRVY
ncbi:collagen alpha-5(VI) chain-like, partial [Exaiptasia diaphana]|uniref:VWFA domain-containing protein n=1 Tax=Exaiptasia diaphana TaxID=2652724 RepID=A0A913WSG2_EXADI